MNVSLVAIILISKCRLWSIDFNTTLVVLLLLLAVVCTEIKLCREFSAIWCLCFRRTECVPGERLEAQGTSPGHPGHSSQSKLFIEQVGWSSYLLKELFEYTLSPAQTWHKSDFLQVCAVIARCNPPSSCDLYWLGRIWDVAEVKHCFHEQLWVSCNSETYLFM